MKLSVFCTTDLLMEDIKELARENIPTKVYGHGPSLVSFIDELGLLIDYNRKPERHADITGWPETKESQKTFARRLAEAVNEAEGFCLYSQPINESLSR